MRQVWITRVGPPEVLELREAPDPAPMPGEVQLRVRASGINFADIMARLGLYPDSPKLPAVVGYEVAGDICAVGAGVTRVVGERVFAITRFGGHMWDQTGLLTGWLRQLLAWRREGTIHPTVGARFPLAEAPAAHHYLRDRKNVGKVVLVP